TNAAGYVLCYAESIGSLQTTPLTDKIGDRKPYEYSFIADADGYLFVGISADSEYTTLTKADRGDCILKDIKEIKNGTIEDWSKKKWVVIGDSLSTLNSTTTKRYIDYIVDKTGIQVEVLAIGGSSWGQPQLNNNAFFQQATRVSSNVDVVTFFGSFNGWYIKDDNGVITDGPTSLGDINSEDTSTRYGCMNMAIKNVYANAPLAKVGIIFPTPWKTANPYTPTETTNSLMEMLNIVAKRWGVPTLDLFHGSGMRPWEETYRLLVYSKDGGGIDGNPNGVHPNEIGHEIIAAKVLAFMKDMFL
ncbi:MAG: SGNH/GDSL hydrolase family protein, partial [Bacilli bacterium]|nr:SGNH/GDSL hydrolase family protein [Bacilli bacterium]